MADARKIIEIVLEARDDLGSGLDAARRELDDFSKSTRTLGAALFGLGTAGVAILGGVAAVATEAGARLNELSERTGVTVERLSALEYVADVSNASLTDLTLGLKFLSKSIVGLSEDGTDTSGLFAQLGVNVRGADGNLRNVYDVFLDVADALSKVNDPALRLSYTLALFGRGGISLAGIMKLGREEILKLSQAAADAGLVISSDAAAAADDFDDRVKTLSRSATALARTLGEELIPRLVPFVERAQQAVIALQRWERAHPGLLDAIIKLTGLLLGSGGLLYAIGAVAGALNAIVPTAVAAWTAITGPVGLVTAAIIGLAGAWLVLSDRMAKTAAEGKIVDEILRSNGEAARLQATIDSTSAPYEDRLRAAERLKQLVDTAEAEARRRIATGGEAGLGTNPDRYLEAQARARAGAGGGGGGAPITPVDTRSELDRLKAQLAKLQEPGEIARVRAQIAAIENENAINATRIPGRGVPGLRPGPGGVDKGFTPAPGASPNEIDDATRKATELGTAAEEALSGLPRMADLAISSLSGLGGVFGAITGGLKGLGAAFKQWAIETVKSILSVIGQFLILKLILSFFPGFESLAKSVPGFNLGKKEEAVSLVRGRSVDESLRSASGGVTVNLNAGTFTGTRGEAVEHARRVSRALREFQTGVRS